MQVEELESMIQQELNLHIAFTLKVLLPTGGKTETAGSGRGSTLSGGEGGGEGGGGGMGRSRGRGEAVEAITSTSVLARALAETVRG